MNGATGGSSKKGTICRYFASTGTCFYGGDCQFLHTSLPSGSDRTYRDLQSTAALRPSEGSTSPAMDLLFQAFTPNSGLPPESKLQTYMNPSARTLSPSVEKSKLFIPAGGLPGGDVSNMMAALSIDSSRKTPNPGAAEFVPLSTVMGTGRLTHSMSSPSFSQYRMVPGLPSSTPFGRFSTDGPNPLAGGSMSQVASPGLSPQHSPMLDRRSRSPLAPPFLNAHTPNANAPIQDQFVPSTTVYQQESVGGTTYFYPQEESNTSQESHPIVLPNFSVYPGNPAHIEHMKPKANAPSFFLPDELRLDILHRHSLAFAQADPKEFPDLPVELDNYHNLCPLEPPANTTSTKSTTFGFTTSVYKATNVKSGIHYCLRRIHGFRVTNTKCMAAVDTWKKLQHSNLVHLREVFTTKAFGDHSIVFVYDYHPGADTLMNQYFSQPSLTPANGYSPTTFAGGDSLTRRLNHSKGGLGNLRQHAGLLPESLIWAYIVQLSSALRTIHTAGLACRAFDPTKILITGKSRLRLNCCGIFDVLGFDASHPSPKALIPHFQQEDLVAFGKVVLALACNSLVAVQRENMHASMELVARNYSADLRNLILYLVSGQSRTRSINDIMPMIGARFYTQLDAAQMRSDVIENELAKEVENGRHFRLLTKLGILNERPEFNMDTAWSETGDRYMLKLFRDYLFHQVVEDGRPWIDMAHIVQCLNKLDAGVPEKICLMSRDEQNVLVVTYSELKQCFESSFNEILSAASTPKQSNPS